MQTDEEIRSAFHARAESALAGVATSPGLLGEVRRRRARRARVLAVGAPLGVGVLTAGAVFGVQAVSSGSAGTNANVSVADSPTTAPSPTSPATASPSPLPPLPRSATLYNHTFVFPSGWSAGKEGGSSHINQGTRFPHGSAQKLAASGPNDAFFNVLEYHGALADVEVGVSSGVVDETHPTTIPGSVHATYDVFGTSKACKWTVSPKPDGTLPMVNNDVGTCPHTVVTSTSGTISVNVLVAPHDSLLVSAGGISVDQIKSIVAAALADS